MNPLELRGPEFLLFYGVFAAAIIAGFWWLNRRLGSDSEPGEVDITDPYEIAFLRGGRDEAIRVAVVKLIQGKVLRVADKAVVVEDPAAARGLSNPLEKAVGKFFASPVEPRKAFVELAIRDGAQTYERRLARAGLLLNEEMKNNRNQRLVLSMLGLWAVAGAKIAIGVSRGRPFGFLIVMAMVASFVLLIMAILKRRTVHGDNAVKGVKQVFAHQRETTADSPAMQMAMVAAVFGLAAIPLDAFPQRKDLFPNASDAGGGGCGSSCGSSCGGGGCGGGGCGGCGS